MELADGRRVAVPHRGTDEVVIVDPEAEKILGAIPVERQPVSMVQVAGGGLVVAHGRARSLVVADPDTLAVTGRIDLPAQVGAMAGVSGSTNVWTYVADVGVAALQLVDTAIPTVVSSIPLPSPIDVIPLQPSAVLDPATDLVAIVDVTAGRLVIVRLSTQSVIGVGSFTPSDGAQALIDPSGARVTVTSSSAEARSWLVGASSLTPDWTYTCTFSPTGGRSLGAGLLSADGARLVLEMPGTNGPRPSGSCPTPVTLDKATGLAIDAATSGSWRFAGRLDGRAELLVSDFADGVWQLRFVGDDLLVVAVFRIHGLLATGQFARGRVSGRTFGIGFEGDDPELRPTVLAWLDPLRDRRQLACDPATPNATGSPAILEIDGGTLGRYVDQVQHADAAGQQRYEIELDALPLSTGSVAAAAGETWSFQSWYRDVDAGGAPTSNFSSAVAIVVR